MIPKSQNRRELEEGKTIEHKILIINNEKHWNEKVTKNIQKPYTAVCCSQSEALEVFKSDDYSLLIIDNDSGDGIKTLKVIRQIDDEVTVIYTSVMPDDDKWLAKGSIRGLNANIHHTYEIASPKVMEIIRKYLNKGDREEKK